jgi:hypothetical protein
MKAYRIRFNESTGIERLPPLNFYGFTVFLSPLIFIMAQAGWREKSLPLLGEANPANGGTGPGNEVGKRAKPVDICSEYVKKFF